MVHAQHKKRIDIEKRVREALEACVATGDKPTFYTIAQRAGVARSTIYRRDDLRDLVEAGRNAWAARNQGQGGTQGKVLGETWENATTDTPIETGCACAPCAPMRELQVHIDLLERQLEQTQIQIAELADLLERLEKPNRLGQSNHSDHSDYRVHTGPRAIRSYIATLSIVGNGADATVRLESCIAA